MESVTSYSVSNQRMDTASSRRDLLKLVALAPAALLNVPANAVTPTGPDDGNLVDLPPEAVRSYLQYRVPLQTSADFYIFELHSPRVTLKH